MPATQLGPISSCTKLAECNEMLSLCCSWYVIPQSPQLMNKRGDKKAPCNQKWQRQIKGEKKGGRPANGGGPEGNRVNVISAMNALSGWMYVCVCGTHQRGPKLVSGALCTLFGPPLHFSDCNILNTHRMLGE